MKIKSHILSRLYRRVTDEASKTKIESGCDAEFFRLNDFYGFKMFRYPEEAIKTHEMQRRAYEAGWAPAIGPFRKFETVDRWNQPEMRYGYVTEIAMILADVHNRRGWWSDYWSKGPNNSIDFEAYGFPNFLDMCEPLGIRGHDFHAYNVGWVGAKPVCIDFSQCGFEDDTKLEDLLKPYRVDLTVW